MLALIYMFAIWFVATVLYGIVNKFEPNPRLALVLKFLILAVGAAAIASRLTPWPQRCLPSHIEICYGVRPLPATP
jgi:hypothetical protein